MPQSLYLEEPLNALRSTRADRTAVQAGDDNPDHNPRVAIKHIRCIQLA